MQYIANENVIGISAFATTEKMKRGLTESFNVRDEALDLCYAMENYADLPLAEKNRIYDEIRNQIILEKIYAFFDDPFIPD